MLNLLSVVSNIGKYTGNSTNGANCTVLNFTDFSYRFRFFFTFLYLKYHTTFKTIFKITGTNETTFPKIKKYVTYQYFNVLNY